MKKLLAALTVLALISIASSAMASSGHQCIQLSYKWYYMSDFAIVHAKLYENGTFQTDDSNWGYWEQFGTSIMLQFTTGCMPLYSGSKKQGFYECTDGDGPTGPNYYMIKKSKNCGAVDAIVGEPAMADGPNSSTPE